MSKIHFPSDQASLKNLPSTGRVAGRVVLVTDQAFTLADATHELTLACGAISTPRLGYLLWVDYETVAGELIAQRITRASASSSPTISFEFPRLRGQRALALRARSRAAQVIREYFQGEDFTEVETPTFVPSPGLDPHVHSLAAVKRGSRTDHLITSPEFHMKRLLVGGMPRIYQFARCFRAEELGSLHEPEFTLLEWYRAFADFSAVLDDTEELLQRVFADLNPERPPLPRPFRRLTVRDAFARFAPGTDPLLLLEKDPVDYFQALVDLVEPGLKSLPGPTFLTEFPLSLAGLARACPEDPRFGERFELYVDGVELCNGYGELTDPVEQRARFQKELERRTNAREPVYPMDEKFLAALEEGLPPSAGNALGFDRLIALATGLPQIASTLAFSDKER